MTDSKLREQLVNETWQKNGVDGECGFVIIRINNEIRHQVDDQVWLKLYYKVPQLIISRIRPVHETIMNNSNEHPSTTI